MTILRRLFQGVDLEMDPDKNRITSGPPRNKREAELSGLPYDGGGGSGNLPPSGGGGGGNEPPSGGGSGSSDSFANSPFKPTPRNIFGLMAVDHRTHSDLMQKRLREPKGGVSYNPQSRVWQFEHTLDQRIRERAPSPDVAYKIQEGIEDSLRNLRKSNPSPSQQKNKDLEIEVALYFGPAVTDFDIKHKDEFGQPFTQVDVETDTYLIEVTAGRGHKYEQIEKYARINSQQKEIILFAPKYRGEPERIRAVERMGGRVFHDYDEMTRFIQKLEP